MRSCCGHVLYLSPRPPLSTLSPVFSYTRPICLSPLLFHETLFVFVCLCLSLHEFSNLVTLCLRSAVVPESTVPRKTPERRPMHPSEHHVDARKMSSRSSSL